jgi:hypothetical protein
VRNVENHRLTRPLSPSAYHVPAKSDVRRPACELSDLGAGFPITNSLSKPFSPTDALTSVSLVRALLAKGAGAPLANVLETW